jgi:spore coat protein H
MHRLKVLTIALVLCVAAHAPAQQRGPSTAAAADTTATSAGEELFAGPVPELRIEIPAEGMRVLREYHQVWRQKRPERIDVRARVREGGRIYSDVAVHLKGSFSFQGIDDKPSLTLNFDKFVPGQHFHGLTKIHLNNGVQDPTGLCEQLARELFAEQGIVSPRATPALVHLNGRDMGVCVLVEGVNRGFVRRSFGPKAVKGNLYDGGAGGDVTKDLALLVGAEPADRSDLKALVDAAGEPDPARRLARLKRVLDVEQFITFAAIEAILVHWDGYCVGCNNYRVFHDPKRDKMVFMPHGLDQLFGTSNSPEMSLTPMFRGLIAKSLFAAPEARARYLQRIAELSTKSFRVEALHARVDRLAKRLSAALGEDHRPEFDYAVRSLKLRIAQRGTSVTRQLASPARPLRLAENDSAGLRDLGWRFKADSAYAARGGRATDGSRRDVMEVVGGSGGGVPGGTWRAAVLLNEGHYEFSGLARTKGAAGVGNEAPATGVMLRISGETSTDGLGVARDWREFRYGFDVRGVESVELVCEFRGPAEATGEFDLGSMRLTRTGTLSNVLEKPTQPDPLRQP